MSQTTTNVGRLGLPDPDLGYDTLDGGVALQAQLRANWTAVSNHLVSRYLGSTTLANTATTSITHNFGLALSALRVMIWESGTQLTAAQVAAHYTITQLSTSAIQIQNTSGGSLTFTAVVLAYTGGLTSTDFDPAVSITTTGTLTAAGIQQSGDTGHVFNSGSSSSGASWKTTLKRDIVNMTADAVVTLPKATSTLATLALTETLQFKTLTSCGNITHTAGAAIDWAAGSASIGASIGANTLTVAGSSSTVRVPGLMSSGTLRTDSGDLVLNQAAAGSGADWTATIRRPASGMAAAAVLTLPAATTTLVGTDQTQILTNKDIQGGTASNTSRIRLPAATYSTLSGLNRQAGLMWYASDQSTVYVDNGSGLVAVGAGGGGGGGALAWNQPQAGTYNGAPPLDEDNGEKVYRFSSAAAQQLVCWLKVPSGFIAGNPVKLKLAGYANGATGHFLMQTTSYLVQAGTATAMSSTTNSRTSTNADVDMAVSALANCYNQIIFDITDTTGKINGVSVAAGDLIRIILTRATSASNESSQDVLVPPSTTEVTFA